MTEEAGRADHELPRATGLDTADIAILAAFARGLNQREIVGELHVSRRTLVRRMTDVRKVLGVETNVEAIVAAVRRGLI